MFIPLKVTMLYRADEVFGLWALRIVRSPGKHSVKIAGWEKHHCQLLHISWKTPIDEGRSGPNQPYTEGCATPGASRNCVEAVLSQENLCWKRWLLQTLA